VLSKERSFLVFGCGRFGSLAVGKLLKKNPLSKITIIDHNKRAIQKVSHFPVDAIVCDGQAYLDQFFSEGRYVDYIVPAVPYHLAFEFILNQLRRLGVKRRPLFPLRGLPSSILGKNGDLYSSFANFLCPENCPEPARYCTVTGKRRQKPLYKILQDLSGPFDSMVIRSEQLGSGVGGFRSEILLGLMEDLEKRMDSNLITLISTACRCHGVTSALSF